MSFQVKVGSETKSMINASSEIPAGGKLILTPQSQSVALNVHPSEIAGFSKIGHDLVIHLKSGEVFRIANFYPQEGEHTGELYLVDEQGKLLLAHLSEPIADGSLTVSYAPQEYEGGFQLVTEEGSDEEETANDGIAVGAIALLGAAAVGGGIAIVQHNRHNDNGSGPNKSDNNISPPVEDIDPPLAATNLKIAADGSSISGQAEPGATVTIDTNGDGKPDWTATVGKDGHFQAPLNPPLQNGETVEVVVTDSSGNTGPSTVVQAPDTTAPNPVSDIVISPDGSSISGQAEPGSTVKIDTNGDGIADITVIADPTGHFQAPLNPPLHNGETVEATATDTAGNTSPSAIVQAPDTTPPAPASNVVISPDGSSISGQAEPGSTVSIDINGDGEGDLTIPVSPDGIFQTELNPPLTDGEKVSVVVVDVAGNHSPAAVVDAPNFISAPIINPSNGTTISGHAEAGSTVVLTDGNDNPLGEVTADGNGNWTFTPATVLADGTVINVVAKDGSGNTSVPSSMTVDGMAPDAPTINPSNGTNVSGQAEAGTTVILTDGNGNSLGEVTADGNGNWTFTPATPLADGTVINVVAKDLSGNVSEPSSVTVDGIAPDTPTINPSDGTNVSGHAEAGTTVILTDGNGNPLGEVTADSNGNWTFTPGVPLADGTVIHVVAKDHSGNTSGASSVTVDGSAPDAPTIDPSNGTTISGHAEAGSTVILTDGNGNPIGEVTADGNGNWTFTPATPLADGTVINVIAKDPSGNSSPSSSVTVDGVAPDVPTIDPSNGTTVSGHAEAGSTVILTDGNGNPVGEVTADGNGNWTFTPGTTLADGTVINVIAKDPSGNSSPSSSVTVDGMAPDAPTINPSNGTTVSGHAEAGSTVILTDGNGNPVGEVAADGNGNWTFTPGVPLADSSVINAVAKDLSGNTSTSSSVTIDSIAPDVPAINPSNGTTVSGHAEAGSTVVLTDGKGNPLGEVTVDGNGNWTFTPTTPLADGTVINAVAKDLSGNASEPSSVTVDGIAPDAPTINPSNGTTISGHAEAGSTVVLTDGKGNPIGEVTADGNGNWTFTPGVPLADSTVINAVAKDLSGNTSTSSSVTIDSIAPDAPTINPGNGTTISGHAEAGSTVILTDGNGNSLGEVIADGSGNWTLSLDTQLPDGSEVTAVAQDASGNISPSASIIVLFPPFVSVPEAEDGWLNAAELSDGIQVEVTLRPTMKPGEVINVTFSGQDGYEIIISQVLTAEDIAAGVLNITITPGEADPFPQGASTITASIDDSAPSEPINVTVDTIAPTAPVLTILGTELGIVGEPGTLLTVTIKFGGATYTATVIADGAGKATLNLLTGFDTELTWDELLNAQIDVVSADAAGNQSDIASIGVAENIPQPLTVGDFGLDFSLFPPTFGFHGTTDPNSSIALVVKTPAGNVSLSLVADDNGHFSLNLLSPDILEELNLTISDLLNLGDQLAFDLVVTDTHGNVSADYGIGLSASGVSVGIGQIEVNGSDGNDILSGSDGNSEHISAGNGNDLILNVGTGDTVDGGEGNDAIQITSTQFASINGGDGFDTIILSDGIDLDYNSPGTGTLSNIERFDLGHGDTGSELTLTAAEVAIITDDDNTLQITGDHNDTLNVAGAINTGTQQIGDISYDVYSFGNTTLLVEENTVKVVV